MCSNSKKINSSCINNYKAIPFKKKQIKGEDLFLRKSIITYIKTDLMYKIRKDLSISDKDKEILTIEITSKESKNMLLSCCYRSPKGIMEILTTYLA